MFGNSEEYENHKVQRQQLSISNYASSTDKVNNTFTTHMLLSPELHFSNTAEEPKTASI